MGVCILSQICLKTKDLSLNVLTQVIIYILYKIFSLSNVFLALGCGHCKKMKPEFVTAAASLKEQNVIVLLIKIHVVK